MDKFHIKNEMIREFLAEMLGTFTLTCIGTSVNAFITVNGEGPVGHPVAAWGWGLALTAAIFICGGVSGGHVNPAVSLGMASIGKLPWKKLPHYFVAQYIGAFIGSVITYVVYREAIIHKFGGFYSDGPNATAGIFGTMPTAGISTGTCVVDQVVAVMFFLLLINAITDERNMNVPKGLIPIAIGLTDLGLVIFAYGYNCGGPINPARDFAPRALTAMAEWGRPTFSVRDFNYFWVPIVACHIGGVLGSWIYRLFIENHWPQDDDYDLGRTNGRGEKPRR